MTQTIAIEPPAVTRRLSKSRFTTGLQCHKLLWWTVHEPDAHELEADAALKALFKLGAEVGVEARKRVPGGVLIDVHHDQYRERVAATAEALRHGAPVIYEAAFIADDTFVAIDILERHGDAHTVTEVKSTTSIKDHHIPDLAIQVHVARRAGLRVTRADLMHLNPECRYPDLGNLFVRADVTARVEACILDVPNEITAQLQALAGPLPVVAIGEHCKQPRECPFWDRCWAALPEHHVSDLYSIGYKKVAAFEGHGWVTIQELPEEAKLTAVQARQTRAVKTARMVVEPELRDALAEFEGPLAYLDFETVSLPIPRWNGRSPWAKMPVQFSCHIERASGAKHHEFWIADGPGDPRPEQAARVVAACAGARRIVAYNAGFERECLKILAEGAPALGGELDAVAAKLVDLLPLVRRHIYHPAFNASFSLKDVLPALVTDLSYEGRNIQDGGVASIRLVDLMLDAGMSVSERRALRQDLLDYCELDTLAMVRLLARVRELAGPTLVR
jgi:predicted RecB family nuclease